MVRGLRKFVKLIVWLVLLLAVGFVLLNMKYPLGYVKVIDKYAEEYQVDKYLVYSLINTESGFHKDAKSSKGANGLMQLMPATARGLGVDPKDPIRNLEGGIKYLSQLADKYDGDTVKVLAAYNAGSGRVDSYGGVPPFPETQNYVKNVLALYRRYSKGE